MAEEIRIENMTQADGAAVVDMMRTFFASDAVATNGSDEIFRRNIEACTGASPFAEGYVFKDGDVYAGYSVIAKSYSTESGRPVIWLEDLFIRPEYRSRGLGRTFMDKLIALYGNAVYRLEVELENTPALALYRKYGFEEVPYVEMIRRDE